MAERAVVVRVDDTGGIWFTISRLTGDQVHGPARAIHPTDFGVTVNVSAHGATPIPHLIAGDLISVTSVGAVNDDWIVLGRLT